MCCEHGQQHPKWVVWQGVATSESKMWKFRYVMCSKCDVETMYSRFTKLMIFFVSFFRVEEKLFCFIYW